MNDAFVRNWELAAQLVALFEHRLDPSRDGDAASERLEAEIVARPGRDIPASTTTASCASFLGMILATVHTDLRARPLAASSSCDCDYVPGLPAPRPHR